MLWFHVLKNVWKYTSNGDELWDDAFGLKSNEELEKKTTIEFRGLDKMALLGTVKEWDSAEEDWTHYIERVKFFFAANDVSTEDKKRAVVGAKHYAVLKGLTENKLEEKMFEELCTLMESHIRPALNVIHERFLFNTRDKKEDESISEYVTLLRKMSEHCNFEEKVNEHLRDRLVVGVKDEKIQERLLGERTLT